MGIKNLIVAATAKAAGKITEKVSELSVLSSGQLLDIYNKREKYLSQKPDPEDPAAENLTKRLLAANSVEIYEAYLSQIHSLYIPISKDIEYNSAFDPLHNIRYFNITKWASNKQENSLEKLVNVYEVLSNAECNIALLFHRTCEATEVYLAVANTKNADNNVDVENYKKRLEDAIKGNFPGVEYNSKRGIGIIPCLDNDISYSVACASNIPTEKSDKFISQTIEKLLDGIVPETKEKEYIIVLLATPVQDTEARKLHLADFYTGLAPYSMWRTNFTFTESDSANSSATFGLNAGIGAGVQQGNFSDTGIRKEADRKDDSTPFDVKNLLLKGGEKVAENISEKIGEKILDSQEHTGKTFDGQEKKDLDKKKQENAKEKEKTSNFSPKSSLAKTAASTALKSVGQAVISNIGNALTGAGNIYKGINFGGNFGANFARSSNVTATVGKNEGITQFFTNYTIKHTLDLLEEQMKRLEQGTALGMWDFAAYVLSEDQNVANNVAHSYLALTQGEKSFMSSSAVNLWRGDMGEHSNDAKEICSYLRELRHPVFALSPDVIEKDISFNVYPATVTATTTLSGKELAYSLNFPQRSVAGLPIIKCAEFGRNISAYDSNDTNDPKFNIGRIFHMNHIDNVPVTISMNSLLSYILITGSSGTGKSRLIGNVLSEIVNYGLKFMVIEPVKGEYKNILRNNIAVTLYSTNPGSTSMLKLNPFSFPQNIHILEHIDRLVEIFSGIMSLDTSMSSLLKNAMENSYIDCGWNLASSENSRGRNLYPCFSDVMKNIESAFSSSDYKIDDYDPRPLFTKLKSLTNGINGMVFCSDEITSEQLFDNNVVVDLCRMCSRESKALIMALLMVKLHEYRMSNGGFNEPLKHITVLEEAHNLLKQSSANDSVSSGDIEMITDAISEMKTYGEGFIIADQTPSILDKSVFRNTNTKIVFRLQEHGDRELVGKTVNLDKDQTDELATLPCGVAAIYQNGWIQPVLCKIERKN